jgi:hypothetical protein
VVEKDKAQTNLTNVRAQLAPQVLAQRIAEAKDRSSYRWQNLDRLERMTDAQIGTTGLTKGDVASIRGYMHTLDAMQAKAAADVNKAYAKAEKEGATPDEVKAAGAEVFDAYTTAALSVAQSAEQVLGEKVKISNTDGWVSIASGVQAPAGVGGAGGGKGKGGGVSKTTAKLKGTMTQANAKLALDEYNAANPTKPMTIEQYVEWLKGQGIGVK